MRTGCPVCYGSEVSCENMHTPQNTSGNQLNWHQDRCLSERGAWPQLESSKNQCHRNHSHMVNSHLRSPGAPPVTQAAFDRCAWSRGNQYYDFRHKNHLKTNVLTVKYKKRTCTIKMLGLPACFLCSQTCHTAGSQAPFRENPSSQP